jgi:hypothetical protein
MRHERELTVRDRASTDRTYFGNIVELANITGGLTIRMCLQRDKEPTTNAKLRYRRRL